jgi:hypothetical protein
LGLSCTTEDQCRAVLDPAGLLREEVTDLRLLETHKGGRRGRPAVDAGAIVDDDSRSLGGACEDARRPPAEAAGHLRPAAAGHADFDASYWAINHLIKRIKVESGVRAEDVRFQSRRSRVRSPTSTSASLLYDPVTGRLRRAWVFVIILLHSRRMVARIVFDQRVETWFQLHVGASPSSASCPRCCARPSRR